MTEEEQNKSFETGRKLHICNKYGKRVYHINSHPNLDRLNSCIKDESERLAKLLEQKTVPHKLYDKNNNPVVKYSRCCFECNKFGRVSGPRGLIHCRETECGLEVSDRGYMSKTHWFKVECKDCLIYYCKNFEPDGQTC